MDAHPQVWGMGEDSLFNGDLTRFRDSLVKASTAEGALILLLLMLWLM